MKFPFKTKTSLSLSLSLIYLNVQYLFTNHYFSAIQMEVVADVYQHQQQTQRNTQSTQTLPYSNTERQRRYREKRRADNMNACSTFSQSSDVQPH